MVRFNLKIAMRSLMTNKVFSIINISGLALSMACCFMIAIYVWNEWRYDTFHKNISDIYRVAEKQNQAGTFYNVAVTPGPLAPALQKDFPEIVNTVRFGNWGGLLKNGAHTYEEKSIQLTDNSVFSVFDFPLVKGNPKTALHSPGDIVITESTADKYFGKSWRTNPSILGQTFMLNNETSFTLAGIAKDVPFHSSIRFDVLLPLSYLFQSDKFSYKWNSNNYHTYLQLKPGTDVKAFGKKIAKQLHTYNPDTQDEMLLQPLTEQYLSSSFDFNTDWGKRGSLTYVKIFAGVDILLLLIACVNFINLSTARSLKRSKEVGIRKVNGASRGQLVVQFLNESVLLAFTAAVLSAVIVAVVQPLVQKITGADMSITESQYLILPLWAGFILLVGVLAGLYPAFVLSAFKPASVLIKSGNRLSGKLFRQGLVVVQFAVSVVLIICTLFMYRQLRFMQDKDLGFNKEQLISIRLGGQLGGKALLFKHDLDGMAGIASAAPATMSLVNVDNSSYVEWEGMQKDDKFMITQANVDPAFLPALDMKLLSGRNFLPQQTNDTATYIINETAAKRMGYTISSAIGKRVNFWGANGTVIGVVKDFNFKPLQTGIESFIFRYQPQDRYFTIFVKTTAGASSRIMTQIKKLYKKYEADAPFEYSFVNDAINDLYKDEQTTAAIILLFTGFTIFVGCLGLFGLTVFATEQRVKEIGIRKVLGATLASITMLLSKDFLKLVLIAILIAVPVAFYLSQRWLQNYAYRIPVDAWVFALSAFGVLGIAFITISFQSVKAGLSNPVKNLRTE